ncbi:MAG: tripartite tricarboxylate transporter substrate binding protein [Deltaproteobacteria bacterium]|nr:tripartite tricarboxylate transporter substrate binding protein [Deltaproteobacteria bacterium]
MKKSASSMCSALRWAVAVAVLGFGSLMNVDASYAQRVYPAKPITLIVPFAAGGGTDIGTRVVAKVAEKHLGKPFVVQNVDGGGSEVGVVQMVRSAPDGYTIAGFNSASVILTTMRKASYDAVKDISPICMVVSDPRLFVVRPDDKRFNTAQDFIKYAKDNPDKLTIGTSGAGTSGHLSIVIMNKKMGVKAKPVHFGGAGESKAAFLGGHIDALTQTYGEVLGMLKDGKAKVIAAATEKRLKELPNVPTYKEIGINLVIDSNRGFAAPKGTPKEVIDKLADAFKKASTDPEYLKQMEKLGLPAKYAGPAEWAKLIKDEFDEYSLVVKDLNVK